MNPVFLWTLGSGTEMMSVLLWSKVVIVTESLRVTSFHVAPDAALARDVALKATEAAEDNGLWLIALSGHPGWVTLPTSISAAHQLFILGRQEQALAVMVDSISKAIVEEGESLYDWGVT